MPGLAQMARGRTRQGERPIPVSLDGHHRTPGRCAGARKGRELISFSCNDYLSLAHHPDVKKAARKALKRYGTGAGASRLVTGSHPLYTELEGLLAELKGTERALVFGSGYLANLGVISALAGKGDLIVADQLCHASMRDGARLSGATVMRHAHLALDECRACSARPRPLRALLDPDRNGLQHGRRPRAGCRASRTGRSPRRLALDR